MLTNRDVKVYEFVFFRSLFNLCASALLVKQAGCSYFADVPRDLRCTLFLRCAVGTVSFMVFSMTVKYLPLGIFFIVFNSSPFFTVILAYFWTSDRILPLEGLAMIGAFCGIVVLGIAKPTETKNIEDNESFSKFEVEHGYQIGMAMALFACVSQSVISVASRRLKSIYFAIIQFNYSLMATISMGVFLVVACVTQKHVPYTFSSGWIYVEVFAAAVANMVG